MQEIRVVTRECGGSEEQVLEHGLRHLAWRATDDAVVADHLDDAWTEVLLDYVPQPFRHL